MAVSTLTLPAAPDVGVTTDGYLLAYRDANGLLVDHRDAALQPIEAPRTIAADYDQGNGCAAGGGAGAGTILVLVVLALRRRTASSRC